MITLTEIMRQKEDLAFAELLNRIRVKQKTEPFSDTDKTLLARAITTSEACPADVIYIFPTNKEVDRHNSKTVCALHKEIITIDAEDYLKDARTGQMKRLAAPTNSKQGELLTTLEAAEGARIMITRNLDVEDGIVNGTFGKIEKIVTETKDGHTRVQKLGLRLDNPKAGQKQRQILQGTPDSLFYMDRLQESLSKKGVVRHQFPVKLAFACTSHKVQGMTVQSAVVSLKHVFEAGMAYVSLSRTTSLDGLYITDFDENKIYADGDIAVAMQSMKTTSLTGIMPLLKHVREADLVQMFKIVHHNTEGLISHINDIKRHHELRLADVLCLTETHLSDSIPFDSLALDGYRLYLCNRQHCYMHFPDLARKQGGGVAIYCKFHVSAEVYDSVPHVTDLEFLAIKIKAPVNLVITAIYRPPTYSLKHFMPNLQNLLDYLQVNCPHPIIVCGDFNENLLDNVNKPILEMFVSRGYTQLITDATTEKNTLLDHIYVSQPNVCFTSGVLQTYYSYHNPVYCIV
ncbi:uncharacterized protein LOC115361659 [Myripristis murdjan]|uniref:uncharacterized protein LOC115361659 n=1 Tax=Myripristis murdjan TaxID=586833 RepID=UPI001176022F|nr:uncharacterized protein LOC115361659 [Myripristis murdjan]